jgi:hypothetical protein
MSVPIESDTDMPFWPYSFSPPIKEPMFWA